MQKVFSYSFVGLLLSSLFVACELAHFLMFIFILMFMRVSICRHVLTLCFTLILILPLCKHVSWMLAYLYMCMYTHIYIYIVALYVYLYHSYFCFFSHLASCFTLLGVLPFFHFDHCYWD